MGVDGISPDEVKFVLNTLLTTPGWSFVGFLFFVLFCFFGFWFLVFFFFSFPFTCKLLPVVLFFRKQSLTPTEAKKPAPSGPM